MLFLYDDDPLHGDFALALRLGDREVGDDELLQRRS
jgi:hypothetical protein